MGRRRRTLRWGILPPPERCFQFLSLHGAVRSTRPLVVADVGELTRADAGEPESIERHRDRHALGAGAGELGVAEHSEFHIAAHLVAVDAAAEFERHLHRLGDRDFPR